jgi:hypothetical protein
MRVSSWIAENRLFSQEGLCSMEWVSNCGLVTRIFAFSLREACIWPRVACFVDRSVHEASTWLPWFVWTMKCRLFFALTSRCADTRWTLGQGPLTRCKTFFFAKLINFLEKKNFVLCHQQAVSVYFAFLGRFKDFHETLWSSQRPNSVKNASL